MAFIADRDPNDPDGVTAGAADDRARSVPARTQSGGMRMPYNSGGAADEDRHLATEDSEKVVGDGVAVK